MAAPVSDNIFVAELTAYDPALPGTRTLLYSSGEGLTTKPTDTPADTPIEPRILQPVNVKRDVFAAGATGGASRPTFGDLVLNNEDGALDALIDYACDGRQIIVRTGPRTAAYPAGYAKAFSGVMEQPLPNSRQVNVRVRDRQFEMDVPLQPTKFTGGNALPAGLEGVADLAGLPKPLLFGKGLNMSPPLVNSSKLIHQVHDGALASIDNVYDRGIGLFKGIKYTSVTSGFGATQIRGIAFGAGLYVAVGETGKLFTSPDGTTWTSRTSTFGTDSIFAVVFAANKFVIVGANGKCATSPDGITWTARTTIASATNVGIYCITYSSVIGLFVIGRFDTGVVETSPDAITWTSRTSVTGFTMQGVTAFAGVFVGVGFVGAFTQLIATSPDGITWTQRFAAGAGTSSFQAVAASPTLVVAIGGAPGGVGVTATSPDGLNWTSRTVAFPNNSMNAIAFGTDRFIAVGPNGAVASSVDGINWIVRAGTTPLGGSSFLWAVGFGNTSPEHVIGGSAGAMVLASIATYANTTDLLDDSLAPDAGTYIPCPSAGYFRLGSLPAGLITCDATQGAAAGDRTAAQMFTALLTRGGKTSADWVAGDITALDAATSAVLGDWIFEERNISDEIDRVADSVGAGWWVDRTGLFRIKRLSVPSGSPVITLTANELTRGFDRRPTTDSDKGIPVYRVVVHYANNFTRQTSDLAGAVTSDRRAILALPSLSSISTDTSVQTAHLLAQQIEKNTLLTAKADADAEAARLQVMLGTKRDRFELPLQMTDVTVTLDLFDVITVVHPRYGLSAGKKFRILGIDPDAAARRLILSVWGGV